MKFRAVGTIPPTTTAVFRSYGNAFVSAITIAGIKA